MTNQTDRTSFRTVLFAALCPALAIAIAGCGTRKKKEEVVDFPPSITAPSSVETTSTLPVKPELAPIVPVEVVSEPVVVVPTTYSGFVAAGKALLASGENDNALDMFTKAAEVKPYAYPRIQMARALMAMGKFDDAREHAEAAVDMDEESTFAWNTLGRVELGAGKIDAAIASFERATGADEHNSYAWNNLGFALIEQERHQEAAEALESATSGADPKDYMWNNLGMAYEHLNLIAEARAAYRQAADLGSQKAVASIARLEGVESLVIGEKKADEGDEPLEVEDKVEDQVETDGDVEDQNDAIPEHDGATDIESIEDIEDEMVEGC